MRVKLGSALLSISLLSISCLLLFVSPAPAQNLGPFFKTVKDGIHVYAGRPGQSNCTIILTQEGVVVIDSGNTPPDSMAVMQAIKQLTSLPVRVLIDTETHNDHTTGHFVFSPPAVIVAAAGTGDAMRKAYDPERIKKLQAEPGDAGAAAKDYRLVAPQIEYHDKMTLNVGERTFELSYLKNVHSEADTSIWVPKERVLFTAASIGVKQFSNLRQFASIPDTLAAYKMMKALNPEIVIPGHGNPGTVEMIDVYERYYTLLLDRVKQLVQQGKTLEQIRQDLKMPEYADWEGYGKDRFLTNVDAAYRAVKG